MKWLALAVTVTACQPGGVATPASLAVSNPQMPAPTDTLSAALYFTITGGSEADTLTGITSGIARRAMLHQSERVNGLRQMRHVPRLPVAAGQTVRLAPGGYHVMLEHLSRRPMPGDSVVVTLTFARAGVVRVTAPVVRYEDLLP